MFKNMGDLATVAERSRISRRRFILSGLGAAVSGLAIDATFIDPQHTEAIKLDIYLDRLPRSFDGFRIAQMSDIHYGFTIGTGYLHKAIALANQFDPDVTVLTGDFVTTPASGANRMAAAYDAVPCAKELRALKARAGSIAVLGNHDVETNAAIVRKALESAAIRVLMNEAVPIERGGNRIWITGVNDVLYRRNDLVRAMAAVDASEVTVLLAHEPDFAVRAATFQKQIDLQLSGHSHGGQVRFPVVGAVYLPALARKYPLGWYQVGKMQLYTNKGLGTIGIPVRFLCPPEVTLVTLRCGPKRGL